MTDKERDDAIADILNRVKGLERAVNGLTVDVARTGQAVNQLPNAKWFADVKKLLDDINAKTTDIKAKTDTI